jgi:hypothetical protein
VKDEVNEMEMKEMYAMKGDLITQLEIIQERLKAINNQIIKEMNKPKAEEKKSEKPLK